MNQARVSVVMPTRDRGPLLEAAVRSVLLQTTPATQILIVDDGSRDPDSVARLAALHPSIEVLRHPNSRGVAAARNAGIERVTGDFVLFLDDDDLLHPHFLENGLATFASRPEADVVVFLAECIFTPDSLGTEYPIALLFDYEQLSQQPLRIIDDGNPVPVDVLESRPVSAFIRYTIPIHSCLLRRSALGEHRFPEALRQGEDTLFWISLAAAGRRFVLDARVQAFVRRHPGNTTRSRERYRNEIQNCYEMLLAQGLLREPDDVYLAHLKLFWFKTVQATPGRWSHAVHLATRPHLFLRELRFWLSNLSARRRLLRYYLT